MLMLSAFVVGKNSKDALSRSRRNIFPVFLLATNFDLQMGVSEAAEVIKQ